MSKRVAGIVIFAIAVAVVVAAGIASPVPGSETAYRVDTAALIKTIRAGTKWSDLGLDQIYGTVMVFSTDPRHSNSGNQYAATVATMLAGGKRDTASIDAVDLIRKAIDRAQ